MRYKEMVERLILWSVRVALIAIFGVGFVIALHYRHVEMLPAHLGLFGLIVWSLGVRGSMSLTRTLALLVLLCVTAVGPVAMIAADRRIADEVAGFERERTVMPARDRFLLPLMPDTSSPEDRTFVGEEFLARATSRGPGWGVALEEIADRLEIHHRERFDQPTQPEAARFALPWGCDRLAWLKAWRAEERRLRARADEITTIVVDRCRDTDGFWVKVK